MNMNSNKILKRGEIYMVNLESKGVSSIQTGRRPCIIVSNERCNQHSPVVTIIPLSSKMTKAKLPTHVLLGAECGLQMNSISLCEQIQSCDTKNIEFKVGTCTELKMKSIERAIKIQADLTGDFDMKYIVEKQFTIKKLKELFTMTQGNKDIERMLNSTISDLKNYCGDFGRNPNIYLNDIIVKDHKNVCAI